MSVEHHIETSCTHKYPHPTKSSAKKEMKRIARASGQRPTLNVYPCEYCHSWHIGTLRPEFQKIDYDSACIRDVISDTIR